MHEGNYAGGSNLSFATIVVKTQGTMRMFANYILKQAKIISGRFSIINCFPYFCRPKIQGQ